MLPKNSPVYANDMKYPNFCYTCDNNCSAPCAIDMWQGYSSVVRHLDIDNHMFDSAANAPCSVVPASDSWHKNCFDI